MAAEEPIGAKFGRDRRKEQVAAFLFVERLAFFERDINLNARIIQTDGFRFRDEIGIEEFAPD